MREPWEYELARVPAAVPVPLGHVVTSVERFRKAAAAGPVYVVCAMGGRSAQAVHYLRAQGIDAVNVAGGTDAWIEAGKPVQTGPGHR